MNRRGTIWLTLLMLIGVCNLSGQNVTLPNTGISTLHLNAGDSITILDPGGSLGYPNNCNSTLTVICDDSTTMSISCSYNMEFNKDFLSLYDGYSSDAPMLGVLTGIGFISLCTSTNRLTINFFSDMLVGAEGFSLVIRATDSLCCQNTGYASPAPPCINYQDIHSGNVIANYGTTVNPRQYSGLVDSGYLSPLSRHTLHTDTNQYDPRTGNLLRMVPPGYSASVRLGNWLTNSEAESITYRCHVDTTVSDLLILRYAAVLQNPNHTALEQPRFSFKILDEDYQEIDPACYSSTFVANSSLGWNSYDAGGQSGSMASVVLWKDWSAVGINLTPLHGQTILIRLTTSDCGRQEHYGYAYFVFDCTTKTIEVQNCGPTAENTFVAPDGFEYIWHTATGNTTLGTEQSLHVTQAGQYFCSMRPLGTEIGSSCSFDLSITATAHIPYASFEMQQITDSCSSWISLHNSSFMKTDTSQTQSSGLLCDSIVWLLDGNVLGNADSLLLPIGYGMHSVSLVASLKEGCSDTASEQFFVDYPCHIYDTVVADICQGESYLLIDTLVDQSGIYHRDSLMLHRTLLLSVHPTYQLSDTIVIIQNQLPFLWRDTVISSVSSTQSVCQRNLSSVYSCDSTLQLLLTVWPNVNTLADSTICRREAPLLWNGISFDSSAVRSVTFAGSGLHGVDSTVTMQVTILENSNFTLHDTVVENLLPTQFGGVTFSCNQSDTSWTIANAAGCDSMMTYSLFVWNNKWQSLERRICDDLLPLEWHGAVFQHEGADTLHLFTTHGADSTVVLTLYVDPTYQFFDTAVLCQNELPYLWRDTLLTDSTVGESTVVSHRSTVRSCDSILTLSLIVNPVYLFHDTAVVCEDQMPFHWRDTLVSNASVGQSAFETHLSTTNSCDSILTLALTVNPSYYIYHHDTVCESELPYHWLDTLIETSPINIATDYHIDLATVNQCDSLFNLTLTTRPTTHYYQQVLVCDGKPYQWIDGNTYSQTTYSPIILTTNQFGCDSIVHLLLGIEQGFRAAMEISPELVSTLFPEVTCRDLSGGSSRQWFFAGLTDTATVSIFEYPAGQDSLPVLLVARSHLGCTDSLWGLVRCDRSVFWVPNAFTPSESINNVFKVFSNALASAEIWIYSRSGNIVGHFDALSSSWDGTWRGKSCPQGAYTWIMRYTTISSPRQQQQAKGTVTLIR